MAGKVLNMEKIIM